MSLCTYPEVVGEWSFVMHHSISNLFMMCFIQEDQWYMSTCKGDGILNDHLSALDPVVHPLCAIYYFVENLHRCFILNCFR